MDGFVERSVRIETTSGGWRASASPMGRVPKGIELMGPRHFGFDLDYLLLEELQAKRKSR